MKFLGNVDNGKGNGYFNHRIFRITVWIPDCQGIFIITFINIGGVGLCGGLHSSGFLV